MGDVFISYKSEDRARVKPLVDALAAEGLQVWWDLHIQGGAAWRQEIQDRLDQARCVLVVWSRNSVGGQGRFVQDEASRADRRGVYLPVAIDAVEPPLGFGQRQVLPLTGWRGSRTDARFHDVLVAVRAMVDGKPAGAAPRRHLGAGRGRTAVLLGAAAAVVVVGAGLFAGPQLACKVAHVGCGAGRVAAAPANSIAVLPLANLSGDPSQEYFSDGLSEELLAALSRIEKVQVAARTSSFKFKGTKDDSSTIGAKLGVAYILDGSVRRDGGLVRVSAQLVDAKSGFERWSQTYDREMKDIFAVQSGIATAVADALKVRLVGDDVAALSRGGTKNAQAYDAYLRGRRLFDAGGDEGAYREALAKFDAAVAADPQFAAAHAGRARTLLAIANQFSDASELRKVNAEALAAARRAVELAPELAEAQTTLASALANGSLNFPAAKAAYERALATGGGDADVLTRYGLFACRAGDTAAGVAALQRAVVLDPLNPRAFRSLGLGLISAGRYGEGIAAMRRVLELSPGSNGAHASIGDALLMEGKLAEARAEYAKEPQAWARLTGEAIVLRALGDQAGAQAAYRQMTDEGGDGAAYQQAQVLAQWRDADGALAAIDRAFQVGDSGVLLLKSDPLMAPLRNDPRWAARVARLGLGA